MISGLTLVYSVALACKVSRAGSHCDKNSNGAIEIAAGLPIPRVAVGVTSLHLVSGQFTAVTDSSGVVAPVNLPGEVAASYPGDLDSPLWRALGVLYQLPSFERKEKLSSRDARDCGAYRGGRCVGEVPRRRPRSA